MHRLIPLFPSIDPTPVHSHRALVAATNAALHLPAMAHEAGVEFDLFDIADVLVFLRAKPVTLADGGFESDRGHQFSAATR